MQYASIKPQWVKHTPLSSFLFSLQTTTELYYFPFEYAARVCEREKCEWVSGQQSDLLAVSQRGIVGVPVPAGRPLLPSVEVQRVYRDVS